MLPVEIVEHEAGAEADGTPGFEVVIDPFGVFQEGLVGAEEFAIVMQVVDPDFEAAFFELLQKDGIDLVIAFRDEIEGRAEPEAGLKVGELLGLVVAALAFDIMR